MFGGRLRALAVAAVAAAVGLALVAIPSSGRAGRHWSSHTLVPASRYVGGSQLAVSESGASVVGWVEGPPSTPCGRGLCGPGGHRWGGFKVMVSTGTASGGFHGSRELSAHGLGGVYTAQLSSGVSYVAWNEVTRGGWRIIAIAHGRVSRPTALPANARLQGLFSGRSRQVAAVWVTPGYRSWAVHYAFLDRHARLVRQGKIAAITATSFSFPQIALNDRGDLAAIWAQGPRFRTAELAWCDARGRCLGPSRLAVRRATPFLTVAVTNRGTVAGLVGAHSGLWTAVAHIGRRRVRVSNLAPGGAPIAVAQGRAGVAVMFSPRSNRLAWTFFDPATDRFTKPRPVSDSRASAPPQLAANLAGQVMASWFHTAGRGTPSELRVVTGQGTGAGTRRVVVRTHQTPAQTDSIFSAEQNIGVVGISGQGDAVVTWQRATMHGPYGLFYDLQPHA